MLAVYWKILSGLMLMLYATRNIVFSHLAVLTVVHTDNGNRIISFRRAGREEREVYHEWLANEFK